MGKMRNCRSIIVPLLILFLYCLPASAAGSASLGKEMARQWCSACHLVDEGQKSTSADIPDFKTIAEKYQDEHGALKRFLVDPHPPMPNLSLTRREIQDLLAYFDSLE